MYFIVSCYYNLPIFVCNKKKNNMIRHFALVFFLGVMVAMQSQTKMRFSLMFNPGLSWYTSDVRNVKASGTVMGLGYGLAADAYFSDNYAFSTGISIESINGNLQYKDSSQFALSSKTVTLQPGTSVKYNVQYLTIPLGLKMKSIEIGYITYFAQLGINTHYTISAKGTSNDANNLLDKDNISREVNFFNLGYHIGGGMEYSIGGNSALIFGIMYNHGFSDITKSKADNIMYNNVSLRLGFLF
jgi:hypothetical protein